MTVGNGRESGDSLPPGRSRETTPSMGCKFSSPHAAIEALVNDKKLMVVLEKAKKPADIRKQFTREDIK
jgi:hypothetical protein